MPKMCYITRKVTSTVRDPKSEAEFIAMISRDHPSKFFVRPWSTNRPLYIVTSYTKTGLKFYCESYVDKTPQWVPFKGFYKTLKNTLTDTYYE